MALAAIWCQFRPVRFPLWCIKVQFLVYYHHMRKYSNYHGEPYSGELKVSIEFIIGMRPRRIKKKLFYSSLCKNSTYSHFNVNSWSNIIHICGRFCAHVWIYNWSSIHFLVFISQSSFGKYAPKLMMFVRLKWIQDLLLFCVFQVMTLLYIAHIIIHAMWKWKIDPDNSAIPYLTALGDLLGSSLLLLAFWFLRAIGHEYAAEQEEIGPTAESERHIGIFWIISLNFKASKDRVHRKHPLKVNFNSFIIFFRQMDFFFLLQFLISFHIPFNCIQCSHITDFFSSRTLCCC